MIDLSNIYNFYSKPKRKRVGRGVGCSKGKTSGRGHKGQKSRSGASIKGFEGGQQSIITRLPKRGFNPINKQFFVRLSFDTISQIADKKGSDTILFSDMIEYKLIPCAKCKVKLLNRHASEARSNLKVELHSVSESAREAAVEKGWEISLIAGN